MAEIPQKNYKQIISELRESLSWTDRVLTNVSEGILVVGDDARVLFANDAVVKMLGQPRITLLGLPIWKILPLAADGKPLSESDYQRALKQNNLESLAGRYEFQNINELLLVDVTISVTAHGSQAVFIIRDVTQQVQREQALVEERIERAHERALREKAEEDERLLQNIINGTTAIVYLKDPEGRYLMVNNQFKKVFNLGDTKIKERTDFDIFPEEIAKLLRKNDEKVLKTKETLKWEESIPLKSGLHTYLFLKYPLPNPDGRPDSLCGVLTDITLRKKLEERKDDFINMASHELKTPLASMKMFLELTQKQIVQGEVEQSLANLSRINNQLDKLAKLTDSLLNVSRIESGKLELEKGEFDLNALAKETIETVQSTTDNHTIHLKSGLRQQIVGDEHRIGQVLLNLLTNAIKYAPGGGDVIVRIKESAPHVTVSVQDFGIGISQENQKKVFDRFYRVISSNGNEFSGLGMGLYISSEIINRHGGTMRVESKKGEGSTFLFQLPIRG